MKGLVWALYLMVQDPTGVAASATTIQNLAATGVTYLKRESCQSDALTFSKMSGEDKATGIDDGLGVAYVCILQPAPGQYKN